MLLSLSLHGIMRLEFPLLSASFVPLALAENDGYRSAKVGAAISGAGKTGEVRRERLVGPYGGCAQVSLSTFHCICVVVCYYQR